MCAGWLATEGDRQMAINSMHQVKSNFLHQSHLVPEGIPFRTSQLVSEAHMWKPFKHSNAVYKDHVKQEEKIEAPEADTLVLVEADGQCWERVGSMWLRGDGSDDGAEIKRLTEKSQSYFTSRVTTNTVAGLCATGDRGRSLYPFFHSHLPAEKSMKFWTQHTGEGRIRVTWVAAKEAQQGFIS